jgi:putative oxidoreductase
MTITQIILWVCIAAFTVPALIFGIKKMILQEGMIVKFNNWGYNKYFMWLIGLIEVSAAIGILFSTTRNWCLYIYCVLLVGAVYTHLKAKDSKKDVMAPIFVFLLSTVIFLLNKSIL